MKTIAVAAVIVAAIMLMPLVPAADGDAGDDSPAYFHLALPDGPLEVPDRYDLREHYYVTPTWDQDYSQICWVLGTLGALETTMVKAGFGTGHLSPYSLLQTFCDGYGQDRIGSEGEVRSLCDDVLLNGGLEFYVVQTLMLNGGPEFEADTPSLQDMLEGGFVPEYHYRPDPAFVVTETTELSLSRQTDEVKWMLSQGLGCTLALEYLLGYSLAVDGTETYNSDVTGVSNHVVSIVGYDDSYPKENFAVQPSEDGAWLVKDSYGTTFSGDGYIWVSYESFTDDFVFFFTGISEPEADTHMYTHVEVPPDTLWELPGCATQTAVLANVFVSEGEEDLTAVSLPQMAVDRGEHPTYYSLQIYADPSDPADPTSGTPMLDEPLDGRLSAGFAKIRLPEPVELDEGQRYSVCFTITDQDDNAFFNVEGYAESGSYIIDPVAGPGESYAYENGVWTDTGATEGIDMPIVVYTEDHVDGGLPALIVIVAAATVVTALALSRRD